MSASSAPVHGSGKPDEVEYVFEPHSVKVPPLRPYLHELWERRRFVKTLARTEIQGKRSSMVVGQFWALLDPLFQAGIYFLLIEILRGGKGGRGIGISDDAAHQRHLLVHVHPEIAHRWCPLRHRWSGTAAQLSVPEGAPADQLGLHGALGTGAGGCRVPRDSHRDRATDRVGDLYSCRRCSYCKRRSISGWRCSSRR